MSTHEARIEKRQGAIGVWVWIMQAEDGTVLARNEWGTNYEFHPAYWSALPLIEYQPA